jgi:hypothetical protein
MGRGLSPHEEVSFRRVALGISKAELLPACDVERLKALSLIEEHESHLRLTPTGRKRYQALPNITAVQQPENRMRPSRNWPLSLQGHAASEGWLPMTDPYVLYYPPTHSYPFLLISFSADGTIEASLSQLKRKQRPSWWRKWACGAPWSKGRVSAGLGMVQAIEANKATR